MKPSSSNGAAERRPPDVPKADMVHRSVARLADLIVAALFARLLPDVVGAVLAISYLLLADGVLMGQSPGKRLGGVKVINRRTRKDALYRESVIRNLPFGLVAMFWYIPILGWVLFPIGGLFVFLFELYMAATDRLGLRIGDVLADTQVVDASVPVEAPAATRKSARARAAVPAEP
jgi:uncharacterized RDD family membrane protein YckC